MLLGKTVNYNNQLSISKYKLLLAASSKMFFLMNCLFLYALKSRGIKWNYIVISWNKMHPLSCFSPSLPGKIGVSTFFDIWPLCIRFELHSRMKESNDKGRSPNQAQNLRLLHGGSLAFCNIKSIKTTATLLLRRKFIFLNNGNIGGCWPHPLRNVCHFDPEKISPATAKDCFLH